MILKPVKYVIKKYPLFRIYNALHIYGIHPKYRDWICHSTSEMKRFLGTFTRPQMNEIIANLEATNK